MAYVEQDSSEPTLLYVDSQDMLDKALQRKGGVGFRDADGVLFVSYADLEDYYSSSAASPTLQLEPGFVLPVRTLQKCTTAASQCK